MLRFAEVLRTEFQGRGVQVEEWRPKPRFTKIGTYRYGGWPKYLGYIDKFVFFPREIRARKRQCGPETVFHIVDHSNAVYAPCLSDRALVVTCHDLLQVRSALGEFPHNRISSSGTQYQRWILSNLAKVKLAVCVSKKTSSDLQRLAGLPAAAAPVVPLGLNYPYRPMDAPAAHAELRSAAARLGLTWSDKTRFLLGVGGAHWYKNRTGLLKIFAGVQSHGLEHLRLVYVGPRFDEEQQRLISALHLQNSIIHLSGLSNEELRAAYSLAEGLIFPSWEEGFGWPVAEAQACGCPVFTSNRDPMTEVGGNAACYFDPADPKHAAITVREALRDTTGLRSRGIERAKQWTIERMIDGYQNIYASLASPRS